MGSDQATMPSSPDIEAETLLDSAIMKMLHTKICIIYSYIIYLPIPNTIDSNLHMFVEITENYDYNKHK